MSYSLLLKNPLWQRKRLEIFQRDEFSCQKCGSKEKELHVHHKYYIFGNKPWDYPDESLITYCYECHEEEEIFKDDAKEILKILQLFGFSNEQIYRLGLTIIGYTKNSKDKSIRPDDIIENISNLLRQ